MTDAWQAVETTNPHAMFGRSEWVLIATDKGRVTEGMPFYTDTGQLIWIAARGNNCADPRQPTDMLHETVTHVLPIPAHPNRIQKE